MQETKEKGIKDDQAYVRFENLLKTVREFNKEL